MRLAIPLVAPLLAFFSLLPAAQGPGEILWSNKISKINSGGPAGLRPGDQFGRGSDAIGDLDGDGVVDLVVGVPKDDAASGDKGRNYGAVYLLFMNADGTVREYEKIAQNRGNWGRDLSGGDEFGRTVAGIGDFNGDGTPDIAVGACYADAGGTNQGAVWLLFLAPDGSIVGDQKISEVDGGFGGNLGGWDQFGRGIVSLGDLDGDGTDDLAIGATGEDDGHQNAGSIWICFMNPDGTVRDEQKISQTHGGFTGPLTRYSTLGFDLINLGDLDGDGVVDIASGAPDTTIIGPEVGALYVIFLNPDGTVKNDVVVTEGYGGFTGDLTNRDEFTCCIGAIGDVDGDGVIDIAVGAGKDDDGVGGQPVNRGAVWILFMNPDGTVKDHQKLSQLEGGFAHQLRNHDRWGTSLATPGDVNGDGVPDLYVGARFDNDGGPDCGALYLLRLGDGIVARLQADFTVSRAQGAPPLDVQFTDASVGSVVSWSWDFGDGNTSTATSPMHTYTAEGLYDVSLTVVDGAGNTDTETRVAEVNVSSTNPYVVRYGCGLNPVGSLTIEDGDPQLGTTILFGLDNPLGTQAVGSIGRLLICNAPAPGYPCGVLIPGRGMDGGDAERLIDMTGNNPLRRISATPWGGVGNPGIASFLVPPNPIYAGMKIYCQGFILDPSVSQGVQMGLTDALELTLYL